MASGVHPQTPKKTYKSSASGKLSCCRLCRSTSEVHFKNIFAKANRVLLIAAEDVYGQSLRKEDDLPHLLCRPCERRLKTFREFKLKITETQDSFERAKRCIEVSPSVPRTLSKSAKDSSERSSRRGLDFNAAEKQNDRNDRPERQLLSIAPQETSTEVQITRLLNQVDKELVEVARRETKSVLRERGYVGMSTLSFENIIHEMKGVCPTVYSILSQMIQLGDNQARKKASLALMYGIIMFTRCKEMSLIQRVNTVLLTEGDASTELVDRLHSYSFCLSRSMKYTIQEDIGNHFLDRAVKLLKEGRTFVFVLDNIDWEVKVHDMRSDKQNTSVHAVATSIVFDRITSIPLADGSPKKTLSDCNLMDLFTLSDEEIRCTRERYKIFIGKILCESCPSFDFIKDILPAHTPCRYSLEMSSQSVVVPLPVLMKDEKKYSDLVDVLDQLEAWVRDIYAKAGLCAPPDEDHVPPGPPIAAPSRPDQPASHVPPVPAADDPLAKVKIPCFGDQLTRVRLAGAKDLRAGSHTPQDRLDHLYPFRIVDWHTKRSFLKLVFKKLYKNSGREQGTLRYFREKLQRRNVTLDVKHYEDCEQFFMSVGKCFTIEALVNFFGMPNKDGRITKNRPPYHILDVGDNKQTYYDAKLNEFIDGIHILPSPAHADEDELSCTDDQDFVQNYSLCLLKYYFIMLDFKDAVREGNGERLATLHKVLLPYFKSLPGFNAYAIEMLISVVQNEVFLSETEAQQCMWASTANWKGGSGKNIEIDLLQENRNKDVKKSIKAMGANKTDLAIERSSKSCGGERYTVENFDNQVNRVVHSSSHGHRSSATDEDKVSTDLRELKPFTTEANRKHDSFEDIMADPLASLNLEDLDKWFQKHKRNLLLDAPLMHDEDA